VQLFYLKEYNEYFLIYPLILTLPLKGALKRVPEGEGIGLN